MNTRKILYTLVLALVISPLFVSAQWGGSPSDWGPDCCDTDKGVVTSVKPKPDPDPDDKKPRATCVLTTDKSSIVAGESVQLTVQSSASSAILYRLDGWKYVLGIFRSPILTSLGSITIGSPRTVSPTETKTYQANVRKAGYRTGICKVTITVTSDPTTPTPPTVYNPSCTMSANPSSIESGGNTVLTWDSSYATSATIDNSIGTVGTVGSYSVGSIDSNTTYTMTVTGDNGTTATCGTTVAVQGTSQQYPSCDVWASPSSVSYGGSTTLHWSSNNATSMIIPSIGSVTPNYSDSRVFNNLISNRTFECRAYDNDGRLATDTTSVTVEQYSYTAPTCSIFASPINISTGGDSTLSWQTSNATSVTLTDMGSAPLNGTKVLYNLQHSKTYTLRAAGPGGVSICTRTVNVTDPYYPPVPPAKVQPTCQIYPVYINRDITASGGGAILNWTAQNAVSATLTDYGTVSSITGTQFVKPTTSKTYTLTVFNDGYRASCSTRINIEQRVITDYTGAGGVTLTSVPYTGVEDHVTVVLLLLTLLTLSFVVFYYRHHIRRVVAPK